MDLLNQAKSALGGAGNQPQQNQQANAPAGAAGVPGGAALNPDQGQNTGGAVGATASTGQQDALDKGVDQALKRAGHGQNAATTEKISDGVRSAFKSATGRDVPIQDKQ